MRSFNQRREINITRLDLTVRCLNACRVVELVPRELSKQGDFRASFVFITNSRSTPQWALPYQAPFVAAFLLLSASSV
jgi:hypothetical protein